VPNAIRIELQVGGVSEIDRAFRTVEQASARFEQRVKRGYDNETQAARKAGREKEREQQRAEREQARGLETSYRQNAKVAADEVRTAKKAADAKLKEEEQWARQRLRIQQRSAEMAYRIVEQEVAKEKSLRERFNRAVGGGAMRGAGGLIHGATSLAGNALALGGGFGIADVVQKMFGLDKAAAVVSNMSSTMPGGRIATKDIASRAKAIGLTNNVDPTAVAESMGAYFAKASDMKGAMANASLFAQLSKATGADMSTIATTAGSLRVQNPNLDEKGMKNMLLGLVGQTRLGAVDIADLAQHVPTITSTSSLYGGDQALNQRKLIGLSQVAMRTSGSSAEAAEAVQRFGSDIASNSGKIQGATGFNVKNKDGSLKDMGEIIAALMQSSKGDIGALKHMGIGRESMKIFEAEEQTFKAAGGGKAGSAAVSKDIRQFTEGGYDEASLASDVANTMNNPGEKFGAAVEKVSQILEEHLTPYLEDLSGKLDSDIIPKVEEFISAMAHLVDWAAEHPLEAVVAALAVAVGKGAVTAAVGEALKQAITKASSSGGNALSIAAAGAVMITAEKAWIEESTKEDKERNQRNAAGQTNAANMIGKLGAAPTQENIAAAKKMMADIQASEGQIGQKSAFGQLASIAMSDEDKKKEVAENTRLFKSLADSVDKLDAAIKRASQSADASHPSTPNRNGPQSDKPRGGT
jgi:hypothetical protein